MPPFEDITRTKVLIVEYEGEKYGLLIDSVEDILTLTGTAQLTLPQALTRSEGARVHNDMREAEELPGSGTLMQLDPASLCARGRGSGGLIAGQGAPASARRVRARAGARLRPRPD